MFAASGTAITDASGQGLDDGAYSVAVQPSDGKILAIGYTQSATTGLDFAVVRYNTDGTVDTSFGPAQNGRVAIDFGSPSDTGWDITVQPDGQILLLGVSYQSASGRNEIVVARLAPDGTRDTTFGFTQNGPRTIDIGEDLAWDNRLLLQDDKIVVLAKPSSFVGTYLVRLDGTDGSVDPTFGPDGNGRVKFSSGGPFGGESDAVLQPDGKIIVSDELGQVRRLDRDGLPDPSFAAVSIGFGSWAVQVDTTGNVYAAGRNSDVYPEDFLVAKVQAGGGSLDTSFGSSGTVQIDFESGHEDGLGLELLDDGKILVNGWSEQPDDFYGAIARLTPTGALDPAFGTSGRVLVEFDTAADGSGNFAVQADGNIVLPGARNASGTNLDFTLVRLLGGDDNDGVPDAVEDGAPNGGDGNNDGIPDSQQVEVTSLPNAVDGQYVTLASPAGTTLSSVQAMSDPPPGLPANAQTPVGTFDFTVQDLPPSGAVEVVLYLPSGALVNQYWKYESVNGWYDFQWDGTTGARFEDRNGDGTNDVVLALVDGGRGDADGLVDGQIVDPGAPVFVPPLLVQIDVRPEAINLANQGVIPLVLFGSSVLDVTHVDLASIRFADATVAEWTQQDVNQDGHLDLVLHFLTQETNLRQLYEQLLLDDVDADGVLDSSRQTASVALTGRTLDDELFEGSDDVNLLLSGRALRSLLAALTADGLL
jgi:uncharacterized delta-60 repeat protein